MRAGARKHQAHDKWVCFACRWTAKIERVDIRVRQRPSYRCPGCAEKMIWTGPAFRPPRKDDSEGWNVAEALVAAGVRFVATRRRRSLPRSRRELGAWLAESERPDAWRPEARLLTSRDAGKPGLHAAGRVVREGDELLVWHESTWQRAVADRGRMVLGRSEALVLRCCRDGRVLVVGSNTRVRLRA